tara:strand:- start:924 stop:1499 length:576 start_codon:yes stop_codon:yes gene_type:complete
MAELKNYHTIRYGTAEGEIQFGHITQDNVLSAVLLRNGGSLNHYISMDATGEPHRKHGTICRSPGSFQVKAGDNVEDDVPGVYIEAKSGDLVLRAPSGRVRIEGVNIDIVASGFDGQNGVVNINGNEKVIVKSQTIDVSSKVSTKIFSEKTVDMIGRAILNMYGGLVDVADGATSVKPSLGTSINEVQNKA